MAGFKDFLTLRECIEPGVRVAGDDGVGSFIEESDEGGVYCELLLVTLIGNVRRGVFLEPLSGTLCEIVSTVSDYVVDLGDDVRLGGGCVFGQLKSRAQQ